MAPTALAGVELGLDGVDGDDGVRAGEGSRHDRGDPDATETDDGHGLARTHERSVEDRACPGEDGAPEDRRHVERHRA